MRYQSALVLSTLAVGQAAATGNLRHASFHKRHEVKRDAQDVDWNNVAYDLSDVDWSKVDYGNGASASASAASAPEPASSQVVAEAVSSSAAAEAPATTQAAAPAQSSSSSSDSSDSSSSGGIAKLLTAADSLVSKLGAQAGLNSLTANGQLWLDGDSDYSATFTNAGDQDVAVWCWGAADMWINANQALISVMVPAGASQKISAAEGFSGGCGASTSDSDLYMGLLNESILEFTFNAGANGCFDISREINMKGLKLTAEGSKCTSGSNGDSDSCTFVCTDPNATRCGKGKADGLSVADYTIELGTASEGDCMVGTEPVFGDPSGGCQMAESGGEHLKVTISGSRW